MSFERNIWSQFRRLAIRGHLGRASNGEVCQDGYDKAHFYKMGSMRVGFLCLIPFECNAIRRWRSADKTSAYLTLALKSVRISGEHIPSCHTSATNPTSRRHS